MGEKKKFKSLLRATAKSLTCRPDTAIPMSNNESNRKSLLLDLPDEILLEILKIVAPKDLSSVKLVCHRLRNLVLNFTVRMDYSTFEADQSLPTPEAFANLILKSPRLRILSLIKPLRKASGQPECFLEPLLKDAKFRIPFAKKLAASCPNIRTFEVSSLSALRVIRDYCRIRKEARVSEIRVYSPTSRLIRDLMLDINKHCPDLRVFKFLRRNYTRNMGPKGIKLWSELWDSMSNKLSGFSTNVIDRSITEPALTRLTALTRIVIWDQKADEIDLLTLHCTNLVTVILMSTDAGAFKYLSRLKHMNDLTFVLQRSDSLDMQLYAEDFSSVFRIIGPNLKKISFDFRKIPSGGCLNSLSYCYNVIGIKLRSIEDKSEVMSSLEKMKSIRTVQWKEDDVAKGEEKNYESKVMYPMVQNLFKKAATLQKFSFNSTMYSRRK